VRQVAVLPSYNSKATVSSLCSLPVPIYSDLFEFIVNLFEFIVNLFEFIVNLFEFIVNLFEFCRISEKRGNADQCL